MILDKDRRSSRRSGLRRKPLGHDLLNGLVEFWPLSEHSGSRLGVHRGLHLTDNNTVTGTDGAFRPPASDPLAAQFTASNTEYLSRASEDALSITGDLTICAWVYLDSLGANRTIAAKYEAVTQTSWWLLYENGTSRFSFYVASGSGGAGVTNVLSNVLGAPSAGSWYLVFAVHDATSGQIRIRVNDGASDSASHAGGIFASTSDFRIGNWQHSADFPMNGRIQDVGIWSRVLTSDECDGIFANGFGVEYDAVPKASLVEWWPLDEISGNRRGRHAGLTLTDVNTVTSTAGRIRPPYGLAARFTAANTEFLSRASETALQTGDIDFTLCAWVFLASKPSSGTVFSKYQITLNSQTELEYDCEYTGDGTDRFRFFMTANGTTTGQTAVVANTFGALALSTWALLFVWHDSVANTINIQVNATAPDSSAHVGGFSGDSVFRIGNWENGATHRCFDGRIERVGFWKRVLTSDERLALYANGRGVEYETVPKTNLIEWWPLNEVSGSRRGQHAGLTLTDNNTVTSELGVPQTGNSLASQFTAANSEFLSRASETAIQIGDFDFSIVAWAYLDSKPGASLMIYSRRTASASGNEVLLQWVQATDRFRFIVYNGNNTIVGNVSTASAPFIRAWYMIVATHDAVNNEVRISVNGESEVIAATTGAPGSSSAPLRIGASDPDGAQYWGGRIQRVGFWKRLLTSDERRRLFNRGQGRNYPFI